MTRLEVDFQPETYPLAGDVTAAIRPIVPADAPLLQGLVSRLTPESVFNRFLSYLAGLTDEQARRLATVDYRSNMAIVAEISTNGESQIIGVARYAADDPADPGQAEVGVVVEDRFHRQGLGSRLLARLTAYARLQGITHFSATITPTNQAILNFIQRSGFRTRRYLDGGVWEVEIEISPAPRAEQG